MRSGRAAARRGAACRGSEGRGFVGLVWARAWCAGWRGSWLHWIARLLSALRGLVRGGGGGGGGGEGRTHFAVAHEEVGDLLEERGVPVVQVRPRGDRQRGEREFSAVRKRRRGEGHGGGDGRLFRLLLLRGEERRGYGGGWRVGGGGSGGVGPLRLFWVGLSAFFFRLIPESNWTPSLTSTRVPASWLGLAE